MSDVLEAQSLPRVILLNGKNYLAQIWNSIGSGTYRNCYAFVDGKAQDIVKDGRLSCAYFVSSLLFLHGVVRSVHTTVNGTVQDMSQSEWKEMAYNGHVKPGYIIVWGPEKRAGDIHKHIGFYVGEDLAISTSSDTGVVIAHEMQKGGLVEKVFYYPMFDV